MINEGVMMRSKIISGVSKQKGRENEVIHKISDNGMLTSTHPRPQSHPAPKAANLSKAIRKSQTQQGINKQMFQ